MKHADVSVVVCTYNRAETLRGALNSVTRQNTGGQFSFEVVVVDDASTDATPEVVREVAARSPIRVGYTRGLGKGIASARNTGIKQSSGDWVAFFDDDQVAESDWLKELFACAAQTGAQVVGGAVLPQLSDEELRRISPFFRPTLAEKGERPHKCARRASPGGGSMLVRKTVFETVGQFDESLTRGGEDMEFSARVRRKGFEEWFTPKAIAHHPMPAYRLKESYLTWFSLRVGDTLAYTDFREWGLLRTLLACLARIAQASLINFPLMLLAYASGNSAEVLGRKCRLLRAWAYVRESLYLVSPRLFSQEAYFSHLSMRREGIAFANGSKSAD